MLSRCLGMTGNELQTFLYNKFNVAGHVGMNIFGYGGLHHLAIDMTHTSDHDAK